MGAEKYCDTARIYLLLDNIFTTVLKKNENLNQLATSNCIQIVTRGDIDTIFTVSIMPPKRKDNNTTSAASGSGPKPKRSKPSFRTPTYAAAQVSTSFANQPSSSNNRVVTLRTGASGRRGYRTQEIPLAEASSSNTTQANDAVDAHEHTSPADHDITGPEIQSDIPAVSKGRTKQKNTTTVRLNWYCIYILY